MHQDQVFCSMWGDPEEWSKQAGRRLPAPSIIFLRHKVLSGAYAAKYSSMPLNTREFYAHALASAKFFYP